MADPISLLLIGGSVIQAGSQVASGFAANAAGKRTSRRLNEDADAAREIGAINAELALEDGRRLEGAALAEAGASGFGIDGTVLDGLAALARASAMDAGQARYEARAQERRLRIEAGEARVAGRTSLITGFASGAGSLVTGVSSAKIASGGN